MIYPFSHDINLNRIYPEGSIIIKNCTNQKHRLIEIDFTKLKGYFPALNEVDSIEFTKAMMETIVRVEKW